MYWELKRASARFYDQVDFLFADSLVQRAQQRYLPTQKLLRIVEVRFNVQIDITAAFGIVDARSEQSDFCIRPETRRDGLPDGVYFAFGQAHLTRRS
jgi:hypothetical protein